VNFFCHDLKTPCRYDEEGDSACPTIPPLRLAKMTYYLFRGYHIATATGGGGETPLSVLLAIEHFPGSLKNKKDPNRDSIYPSFGFL
jgi:hypothetical protein